jgi:microcystin-dependent protein
MGQPFIGEIRMFAGSFAPVGWEFCNGQMLPIAENEALFTLIGTIYGGDGQSTFALPNLQSRVPVHYGQGVGLSNYTIGEMAGVESVTLTSNQTPTHNHAFLASTAAGSDNNAGNNVIADGPALAFIEANPNVAMAPQAVGPAGGSQPHENRMPILVINYIISLFGIFPPNRTL